MAENLIITTSAEKEERYLSLIPQINALIAGETDLTANLANIAAALKEQFNWLWVGFYLVKDKELVLGPFQGPVACTRIGFGKGVCGTAWKNGQTLIVPNVDTFPGHIACSTLARSEIVVPFFNVDGRFMGVLDADSESFAWFNETDQLYLEELVKGIHSMEKLT